MKLPNEIPDQWALDYLTVVVVGIVLSFLVGQLL